MAATVRSLPYLGAAAVAAVLAGASPSGNSTPSPLAPAPSRTDVALDAGAQTPDASSAPEVPCPPAEPTGPHCVYLTLRTPSATAAEKLAKKLRTDGVESDIGSDHRLSVALTDAQLAKLLGAKVGYSLTGASASDRMLCDAQVRSFKAPGRYQELAEVRIDPACP